MSKDRKIKAKKEAERILAILAPEISDFNKRIAVAKLIAKDNIRRFSDIYEFHGTIRDWENVQVMEMVSGELQLIKESKHSRRK